MSQSGGRSTSEVRLPSGVHDAAAFLITRMLAMNDEGRSDEYILLAIMAELSGWFALTPPGRTANPGTRRGHPIRGDSLK